MNKYIDIVLKKAKKPLDLEKIYQKVELLIQEEDSSYQLSDSDRFDILEILSSGVEKLDYYRTPSGKYTSIMKTSFRKGRFHGNNIGEGFVTTVSSSLNHMDQYVYHEKKYSISSNDVNHAIDGDRVLIEVMKDGKSAKVLKILDRNLENIVGEVVCIGNSCFLKPLDKKKQGIMISLNEKYEVGTIASVKLVDERAENYYIGKVTRVFQHKGDPHEASYLEAFKAGMPEGFSEASMQQLDTIPDRVLARDKAGRVDFTKWNIFSMDGKNTQDKDDCIYFQLLENGNVLVGVFIADPPHYIPTNSPLHKDAIRKGNSYYFEGCVEAQYPKKISDGVCSLHDGVERVVKAIVMEYTPEGKLVRRELVPGVIHSKKGMVYEEANLVLEQNIVPPGYENYASVLVEMSKFAEILRQERLRHGAIEIEQYDPSFIRDENGKLKIRTRVAGKAENLNREFMLAANHNVGEILTENGVPCVYRIHGYPNKDRLKEFLRLLDCLGFPFGYTVDEVCADKFLMQQLSDFIATTGDLAPMLTSRFIQCMSRAEYSANNIGHYGTGFDIYIHFTSPIRRLADDTISRIIDDCIFEKDPEKKKAAIQKWSILVPELALQATKMERVADNVARNIFYRDSAEYLSEFIGETFEGTVIEIGNNGLTVQLDNLLEGRIRTRTLPGNYIYNPTTFTLLSLDNQDNYYVGDRLKLRLVETNPTMKTVDFIALEKIRENRIEDINGTNTQMKKKTMEKIMKRTNGSH